MLLEWLKSLCSSGQSAGTGLIQENITFNSLLQRDPVFISSGPLRETEDYAIPLYGESRFSFRGKRKLILNQINTTWNTCFVRLVSIKNFMNYSLHIFNWEASQKYLDIKLFLNHHKFCLRRPVFLHRKELTGPEPCAPFQGTYAPPFPIIPT